MAAFQVCLHAIGLHTFMYYIILALWYAFYLFCDSYVKCYMPARYSFSVLMCYLMFSLYVLD